MNQIHSFPPLAQPEATCLILGTMPGAMSLAAQQYYAHPRNGFWQVIDAAFGISVALSYAERCRQLTARGIAVWDVLKTCTRSGSLDSAIDADSIVPNDFASFLESHPHIELICFNGTKAEQIWRKHIAPSLKPKLANIRTLRLPSTSPAHAGMPVAVKAARWRDILNPSLHPSLHQKEHAR